MQNTPALVFLTLWVHLSSCFNLDFAVVYWHKLGSETKFEHVLRIGTVIFKYSNMALFLIVCALWPLLSWLDYGFTQLDTDYYALRYFYNFLYMAVNNIPYSAIDNMQMLVGDNFFLLQITNMLLYNTISLRAQVFAMGPMLIVQNGKICYDIVTYVKEPFQKTSFVRLISPHDSLFLMLVFTGVVEVMALMDAVAVHTAHLMNLIYVPLLFYMIVKIMDTKQAKLARSFFPIIAAILTAIGLYVHLAAHVVASKHAVVQKPEYPLW